MSACGCPLGTVCRCRALTAWAGVPITRATYDVLEAVLRERNAQDVKWGEQNHPDGTGVQYLGHAAGARDECDREHSVGQGTWRHILLEETYEALAESDPARLRTELLQVAAVAAAWVEAIDRRAET